MFDLDFSKDEVLAIPLLEVGMFLLMYFMKEIKLMKILFFF